MNQSFINLDMVSLTLFFHFCFLVFYGSSDMQLAIALQQQEFEEQQPPQQQPQPNLPQPNTTESGLVTGPQVGYEFSDSYFFVSNFNIYIYY